jgi:predicted TIM-barrel fold metal-dependent hydrolase
MSETLESEAAPEGLEALSHAKPAADIGPSRREFIAGMFALSAGVMLPRSSFAAGTSRTIADGRIIDVHRHFFPPEFVAAAREKYRGGESSVVSEWTPEKALADMDQNGVATAILSITTPGIWLADAEAAGNLARTCNEFAAQLARDYPKRFGFFAVIPLPDTQRSLQEVAYALDTLHADGIGLMTSYGNKWLGDRAFTPVFDELNRRQTIVYVHSTVADCCRDLMPDVPAPLIEFPHDTTRAIANLIYSGTVARCRGIRFIFANAGGTMPMLAGRVAQLGNLFGSNDKVPQGIETELRRFYYEIANSANRAAMRALMSVAPVSQILFGSDSPFVPTTVTATGLASLGLTHKDLQSIQHETAEALFPRLKIRAAK